jgi:uncharacterized protein (UPF0216 family)
MEKPVSPQIEEFLRDIEERLIPELRKRLEPLESGIVRRIEIRDGKQVDLTQDEIRWLKNLIAQYQAAADKIRGAS